MSGLILDGQKLAWHQDRVNALLRGERVAPITIDCALTRRCTYKCLYCYGTMQENPEKRLTRDVIFSFLDDAAEIGVKAVSFVSDGESTCSQHLYDSILRGKANGLDMALGTNGYLLRRDRLEEILPALTYLRFNISAATPDRYAQIHGCRASCFEHVYRTIAECVSIKRSKALDTTIGLQMVLLPEFADQVLPLAALGRELGVDYLVVKHCSDDEEHTLGVDYDAYFGLVDLLERAEGLSDERYAVKAKWSKILSGGKRSYSRCLGPPLICQFSGSGLVAPCGMLFGTKYERFHIGNLAEQRFKDIWSSERYWEVMRLLASPKFDARTMCGSLCLQHKVNEVLFTLQEENEEIASPDGAEPMHVNFV